MSIRLLEEVFNLVNLIRSVDRNENRADFRCCPEGDEPRRNIRCPYCNVVSRLYAERNERSRTLVNVAAELRVRSRIVESCIFKRILVGVIVHHCVKHIGKRRVDNVVLFPHKRTCF